MTDLIRLEDALSVCSAYCPDDYGSCSKSGHDLREMLDELEALPTIEADPVRHGRWILEREPDGTPYCLHCSECDPDFAVMYNVVATNYCPDCGAKMETDRIYERDDYFGIKS